MGRLFKIREVAERLGVSDSTVRRLIDADDLGAVVVSPSKARRTHIRVREEELERYIKEDLYEPNL